MLKKLTSRQSIPVELIQAKAYEIWATRERNKQSGTPEDDWSKAIEFLNEHWWFVTRWKIDKRYQQLQVSAITSIKNAISFKTLSQAVNASVLIGAITFIASEQQRRDLQVYQAWQVISAAAGQGGSGGRIQALEFLNSEPRRIPWFWWRWQRESLSGLEAPKAYLVPARNLGKKGGIQLSEARLSNANLQGADLRYANLKGASLIDKTNLEGAILSNANLQGAKLNEANLRGAKLMATNLSDANLSRTNLSRTNLSRTNLSRTNLSNANLSNANLSNANLSNANLSNANLSNANLSNANLSYANPSYANPSYANLSDANLSRAVLSYANLSGANLSGANLSYTILSDANLSGANLSGANLSYANLRDVNLSSVDLEGAIVANTWFGGNIGLAEYTKRDLEGRGAIFNDNPKINPNLPFY